jgi:hypothetical protein
MKQTSENTDEGSDWMNGEWRVTSDKAGKMR